MDNKSYIVAVDVGSSEVVVAVGSPNEGGVLEILTVVSEPTDGVSAGLVDNSKSVGQALRRARERAEQDVRIAITDAYVGISGKFVRCARYTDHVFVEDVENCISQRDVNALMERMRNVKAADGEVIMDLFPLSYKGDAGTEMRNPVGCYSKQLSSTYNFILCEHMAKDRLRRVFLDAGIKIRGMFANAAVMADSVVSTDEKEEGVAVVDIGGGVTDVAVYYGGALRYIASIPIGGSAVNADIRAYGIPEKQVEKLKKRYGTAVADLTPDDIIQVRNSSRSLKSILRLNLAAVIEARMTDIAEYVWNEIRDAGFGKKLSAGIVLTGGGARGGERARGRGCAQAQTRACGGARAVETVEFGRFRGRGRRRHSHGQRMVLEHLRQGARGLRRRVQEARRRWRRRVVITINESDRWRI